MRRASILYCWLECHTLRSTRMTLRFIRRRLLQAIVFSVLAAAGDSASAQPATAPAPNAKISPAESTGDRLDALIRQSRVLDATAPARALSVAREALALARLSPQRADELRALDVESTPGQGAVFYAEFPGETG
jgi:hypothetical protein